MGVLRVTITRYVDGQESAFELFDWPNPIGAGPVGESPTYVSVFGLDFVHKSKLFGSKEFGMHLT